MVLSARSNVALRDTGWKPAKNNDRRCYETSRKCHEAIVNEIRYRVGPKKLHRHAQSLIENTESYCINRIEGSDKRVVTAFNSAQLEGCAGWSVGRRIDDGVSDRTRREDKGADGKIEIVEEIVQSVREVVETIDDGDIRDLGVGLSATELVDSGCKFVVDRGQKNSGGGVCCWAS